MADEWVLTPVELTNDMGLQRSAILHRTIWTAALSARPPIPRPVWDAMVERGARARAIDFAGTAELEDYIMQDYREETAVVLRAALNNPRVEGDEP